MLLRNFAIVALLLQGVLFSSQAVAYSCTSSTSHYYATQQEASDSCESDRVAARSACDTTYENNSCSHNYTSEHYHFTSEHTFGDRLHTYHYGVTCPDGDSVDEQTGECITPEPDCESLQGETVNIEWKMSEFDGVDPQNASFGGCGVTLQSTNGVYSYEGEEDVYVGFTAEYTGEDETTPPTDEITEQSTNQESIPEYNDENIGEWTEEFNSSFPENGCVTDSNGVETCVSKEQAVTIDNVDTSVEWDGNTLTAKKKEQDTETETTEVTTTTFPDGSQTVVNEVTKEYVTGGQTTTTSNTSGTTTESVPPDTTTTTTTTTTQLDSNGDVVSETVESQDGENPDAEEEATESDGQGMAGNYEGPSTTGLDNSIDGLSADPAGPSETAGIQIDQFTFGQTCSDSPWTVTYLGRQLSFDFCTWINIVREILYWVFALFTAIFLFRMATTLNG